MRIALVVLLLLLGSALHAQENVPADTAVAEEYQYVEDSDDSDDEEDYDSEDSEAEVTHTVIPPDQLPTTQKYTQEKINVRKFDDAQWKEIVGKTDYEEKPEKEEPKEKGEEEEPSDAPSRSFSAPWAAGGALGFLGYIIIAALIIFIIYYVLKDIRISTKLKAGELADPDLSAPVENIEQIDVTTALQRALAEGNYKLAVRMYFLDLLKKLNESGQISWKKDKTNRDYLGEIYAKAFHFEDMQTLTFAYEQIWYGDHTLPTELYQRLFSNFESAFEKINASSPAA